MVNPLLFEKNVFVCTSKMYMFPFQSDNIFRSDTRSPVLSRKSFVFATSGPLHACSSPVPPIAVRNCKNISNCSICSVSLSISNVDRVSKPAYPVVICRLIFLTFLIILVCLSHIFLKTL